MKHFKNPVSMRVTQEQFENDLRKTLEDLGAMFEDIREFSRYHLLVSNAGNRKGFVGNVHETAKKTYNRHFIETYDPEQFIAICKLEVEMIVGECYGFIKNNGDKIFKCFEKTDFNTLKEYKEIRLLTDEEEDRIYSRISQTCTMSIFPSNAMKQLEKIPKNKWVGGVVVNDKVFTNDLFDRQIEVKDELIITDSEPKPKPIKVIDKVKSDLKQAKKKVKLLTEVLKYLENGI